MISIQAAQAGRGERVRYRLPDPSQPVREGTIKNVVARLVVVRRIRQTKPHQHLEENNRE